MAKTYYYTDYDFEALDEKCEKYIRSMEWDEISKTVVEKGLAYIDITDCVGLFSHIEVDEDYRLFAYISREYHGLHGKIAAIKNGESAEGELRDEYFGLVDLTETAVNPMEVIYNDGTPEGYLEAVIFSKFIVDLPNNQFAHYFSKRIIADYPEDFYKKWNVYIDVNDIRPKAVYEDESVRLFLYFYAPESIFLPYEGRDRIVLNTYYFDDKGFAYWFRNIKKDSEYKKQTDMRKKYTDTKRCCLFVSDSMCLAKQKKNEYRIIVNAVKCKHCGEIIESISKEEIVVCSCGSCEVSGGDRYLARRCIGGKDSYIEMSVKEEITEDL